MVFAAWHLVAMGLSFAFRDSRILAGAGLLAFAAMIWRSRGAWTTSGVWGWANGLTLVRLLGVAALLALPLPGLVQAAGAFTIFALDGLDGAIARRLSTSSEFGAKFDKECDAFFVMAVCTLLWLQGVAGPWVLAGGLWRYAYGLVVSLAPAMRQAPRSNWARYSYSTACVSLILALVPQLGAGRYFAGIATLVISLSFLRSIYFSLERS